MSTIVPSCLFPSLCKFEGLPVSPEEILLARQARRTEIVGDRRCLVCWLEQNAPLRRTRTARESARPFVRRNSIRTRDSDRVASATRRTPTPSEAGLPLVSASIARHRGDGRAAEPAELPLPASRHPMPLRRCRSYSAVSTEEMSTSLSGRFRVGFALSTRYSVDVATGSCCSAESAPGPFHHGIRRRGGTIFRAALTSVGRQVQADMRTAPHPSSRKGHHSTARWGSIFLLLDLILHGFHAAAAACSRVQRNSVPWVHMRCIITANRRARATIAFFIPRRLAICIAQALSQDHFFDRSML